MATFRLDDEDVTRIADAVAKRIATAGANGSPHRWLSSKQAAEHLAVSVRTIHELTAQGTLPHHQTGPNARVFFRADELDQARANGLI